MNCPVCKVRVAFTKNKCDNCGQDLTNYRRIVSMSNLCYNQGLEQAKVRDLSGAIISLRQSLQYNKFNTNARNLLGLIYYETGEMVAALSEWVLSKNFQEKDNDADRYLEEIHKNQNRYEAKNQAIKKFNSALYSAQHGDEDMAIIELKKLVSANPKFIKAHQLLALLYMMSEKKEDRLKAYKLLMAIKKVDVTNTTTLRYLRELSDVAPKAESVSRPERKVEPRRTVPRVEPDAYRTITPYKEEKPSVLPFVNVIVGIIIGLALMYCLIIPHMKATQADEDNENFKKYSQEQAANDSDVAALKNENDKLKTQVDQLEADLAELQGGDPTDTTTLLENYDALFESVTLYMNQDNMGAAKKAVDISKEDLASDAAKKLYKKIKNETFSQASDSIFEKGRDAYNGEGEYEGKQDYDVAMKLLQQALKYNPENTDAMYFLGRCYQQTADTETAITYYNQIVNDYPDSARFGEASSRLRELGQ